MSHVSKGLRRMPLLVGLVAGAVLASASTAHSDDATKVGTDAAIRSGFLAPEQSLARLTSGSAAAVEVSPFAPDHQGGPTGESSQQSDPLACVRNLEVSANPKPAMSWKIGEHASLINVDAKYGGAVPWWADRLEPTRHGHRPRVV